MGMEGIRLRKETKTEFRKELEGLKKLKGEEKLKAHELLYAKMAAYETADDLGYGKTYLGKLRTAKSVIEIERILVTARRAS